MRLTSCVLDFFSGISRIAVMARCPFLSVDERARYVSSKEFELNDLCITFKHKYVFSFGSILNSGNYKEMGDLVVNNIKEFVPKLTDKLLSSLESYIDVSYDLVKSHKEKKFGIRFIKVEKIKI